MWGKETYLVTFPSFEKVLELSRDGKKVPLKFSGPATFNRDCSVWVQENVRRKIYSIRVESLEFLGGNKVFEADNVSVDMNHQFMVRMIEE